MNSRQNNLKYALACVAYYMATGSAAAQTADPEQPLGPSQSERAASDTTHNSQGIQEIIVTAERRTGDVQNVAAAVSVRSGEQLTTQGKFSLRQVLDDIPSVVVLENNSRNTGSSDVQGANITIRGISPGNTAGAGSSQISATPSTAVYVDGVYEGVGSVHDLGRVEVLRGPQGTLYGRSATAGVVAFHTRNPTLGEFEANGAFEYGSYALQHYTVAANLPLGDTLAIRLSGDYRDQDKGYYDEAKLGKRERLNGRAKLLWEPTADLSILLGYAYEKDKAFSGGNQTTINSADVATTITSPIFPGRKTQNQYWAEVNWDLGPVAITYQPAYRTWKQNDVVLLDGNFIGSGASLRQLIDTPKNTFHTQELRIASQPDSKLSWQAGLFYYRNILDTSSRTALTDADGNLLSTLSETANDKITRNIGIFAEATYKVNPALRLNLGVRYDDTKVVVSEYSFENNYSLCGTLLAPTLPLPPGVVCTGPGQANQPSPPGVSISDEAINLKNFNYKIRVEYDLAARNMVYASVSTGFRPGDIGIDARQTNRQSSERLTAYEIGSKNRFFNNSLQLNFAGFYYAYSGFQVTYRPETASPNDDVQNGNQLRTTVPARNIGGEIELLYQPTDNDRIMLNYNYVQSRWVNKPAGFAAAQLETERALTPHSVTTSYEHSFQLRGGSIAARIDGKFESAHRTQDLHVDTIARGNAGFAYVDDRLIGNAQLTFLTEDKRFSLTAYVRNFTDTRYRTIDVTGTNLRVNRVDPRIFGIIASVRY